MTTQDLYDEYGFLHPKWKEKLSIINGYLNTFYTNYPQLSKTPEALEMRDAVRCIDYAYIADELEQVHVDRVFAAFNQLKEIVRGLDYGLTIEEARKA